MLGPAADADGAGAGQRALVVGAGTGYSAAVLPASACEVMAVESSPALAAAAREHGHRGGRRAARGGYEAGAPYDQILIDGAVEYIPDAIIEQLADGGRLGAALSTAESRGSPSAARPAAHSVILSIGDAGVPALPGFSRPKAFTF